MIVHANPGHGTGEAEAAFDEPGTVLAALEDAVSAAGWTLVTARPEITPPAAETAGDIPALLRQLARAIDDTLGTESA